METKEPLDIALTHDMNAALEAGNRKNLIRIVVLIVVNTLLFGFVIEQEPDMPNNFIIALQANLLGYTLFGFLIGLIVALFPYKGLPYSKRYLRGVLLTILTIHFLKAIGLILLGLMMLVGWY